ncbi:PTS transporter subunit IIABC [Lachnobacterium bovis]|uniref:PTS system, D-glucosamine-specific IIC component n=1 Tax=Lachnobacterium bovis TaxID=140626 RepID=A0A1H9U2I8_9FIRM|nr:PTS transporter subunit IIABC [Lachnobacterium bovis]SES03303.1 PTS system, D-glucosamine-specific IIC component [Lachnobacterium bovis]
MKDKIFEIFQRIGHSFMIPIAILPIVGCLLGIGSSFTNQSTIELYHLQGILGKGHFLYSVFFTIKNVSKIIFDNIPMIFAVGVASGMAKKQKEVAAFSAMISYFVMNSTISSLLILYNYVDKNGIQSDLVLKGAIDTVCGVTTLQTGVFGGVIVGLGVAALHNRFYKIKLPNAISFFGGTRFIPIISTITYFFVGVFLFFTWPIVQLVIVKIGQIITKSSYFGTLLFGVIKRLLIPLGLHHIFYIPFWQTALGGTVKVGGKWVSGAQNIFFAQLLDLNHVSKFSVDATRFFSGEYIFMMFGLPGAALAIYQCAKKENKEKVAGIMISAAVASIVTGITEPIEFAFLFVAPVLFGIHVVLAGSAYVVAQLLHITISFTFSAGLIDFVLFGILPGNSRTNWILVIPVGMVYFVLYNQIFKFVILKFDIKTMGREDQEMKDRYKYSQDFSDEVRVFEITQTKEIVAALGGKKNIVNLDCCATRLRVNIVKTKLLNKSLLKQTGATGVVLKGKSVQIIYGPRVATIKTDIEEYLENCQNIEVDTTDINDEIQEKKQKNINKKPSKIVTILSPFEGEAADLSNCLDEAFAQGMMGEGAIVTPEKEYVYAPDDGVVGFVFDTNHAIGFLTNQGISLLIHIGIDTIKLDGKGIEILVDIGQKVTKGEPIMKLDLDYLKINAKTISSPIICTDVSENMEVKKVASGHVKVLEPLFDIYYYG